MTQLTAYSPPTLSKIGKVEIGYETSYNTASASMHYWRCDSVDLSKLTQEFMDDTSARADLSALPKIVGPGGGEVTIKGQLFGRSGTVPSAAAADITDHILGPVIAWLIGTAKVGGYVSQDPTGSTTGILKGANLSDFPGGDIVGFLVGSTPVFNRVTALNTSATPEIGRAHV
mgnify:CR=1 FL=1